MEGIRESLIRPLRLHLAQQRQAQTENRNRQPTTDNRELTQKQFILPLPKLPSRRISSHFEEIEMLKF